MTAQGTILSVDAVQLGSELTVAANVNDPTVHVADSADFFETGGYVSLGGVVYTVTAIDDVNDILTLGSVISNAAAIGEIVMVWDNQAGVPAVRYEAAVVTPMTDNVGDPIIATITPGLAPFLPLGPRNQAAGNAESCTMQQDAYGTWWVDSISGRGGTFTIASTPNGSDRIDINATLADAISFYFGDALTGQVYTGSFYMGGSLHPSLVMTGAQPSGAIGGTVVLNATSGALQDSSGASTVTVDGTRVTLHGPTATSGVLCNSDTQINGNFTIHGSASSFNQDGAVVNGFVSKAIAATSGTQTAVGINPSNGIVVINTSARRFKDNIQPLDTAGRPSLIDSLQPVTYEDKAHNEAKAAGDPEWQHDVPTHLGFIAEDVADTGWTELVNHNSDGEIVSLAYDRILAPLILELRELKARVAELEGRAA